MRIDSPESINDTEKKNPTLSSMDDNNNNQAPNMQLNNENKEIDDLITNEKTNPKTKRIDIYEKADILDLIHAVQINSECSPLDKENSHFIMCDLTIAANELMKTQELELDNELEFSHDAAANKTNKAKPPIVTTVNNRQSKLMGTNSIRINDKSVSSSNLFTSFDQSSISNSLTSSTKHNSPLFFTLEQAADTYSPIDTHSNSSPVSNYMSSNFNESNGMGVNNQQSFSPNSKEKKRLLSKQKSSFNRSISNSNSSTLNNINEIEQSCETSIYSSSASNVCTFK